MRLVGKRLEPVDANEDIIQRWGIPAADPLFGEVANLGSRSAVEKSSKQKIKPEKSRGGKKKQPLIPTE